MLAVKRMALGPNMLLGYRPAVMQLFRRPFLVRRLVEINAASELAAQHPPHQQQVWMTAKTTSRTSPLLDGLDVTTYFRPPNPRRRTSAHQSATTSDTITNTCAKSMAVY